MPILIMALIALAVFLAMGLMLFSATVAEKRARADQPGAPTSPGKKPKPKTHAAHA